MRLYWPAILGLVFAVLPASASAQSIAPPPVDSVVAAVRARLEACDSLWTEATFITTTHERELNDDGSVDKETTTRTRTFVRGEQEREILEGMWVNGEPVSDKKLADERRKHLKEQREARKKEEKRAAKSGEPDAEEKHEFSAGMLAPFTRAQVDNYDFPALAPDTLDGTPAWRITVTPRREEEGLIKGTAWVDRETCRGLAEQYELAKKPGPVKAMDFRFEYAPIGPGCTAPRRFFMRGHGKALLIIKFRFEVEALIDSVQLNPMLPDSLFTDESD